MRQQFDQLKAGSDKYNKDVADIIWLVSFLKGLLQKNINELPHGFTVRARLFEGDALQRDFRAYGICLRVWRPAAQMGIVKDINVTLELYTSVMAEDEPRSIQWNDFEWALEGKVMSPRRAAGVAENLDLLLESFMTATEKISPKTHRAVVALLQNGRDYAEKTQV